jgi:hypothetical protein
VYGSIFSTELSSNPPWGGGVYGFVERGSFDNLPEGVIRVEMPYSFTTIAIRIDRYSSSGENQITAANDFRANLAMQTLANYEQDSTAGKTLVLPLFYFSPSVKLMADEGLAKWPEAFLTTLQEAMASPATQPITDDDRSLVQRFDTSFAVAKSVVAHDSAPLTAIVRGAQAAYAAIINRWQSHRGPTNWIHFNNIGEWGTAYLDRAALTEYIQVGNNRKAAYYANAFVDASGLPLDGGSFGYTITFTKDELPEHKRFWSMTAYTHRVGAEPPRQIPGRFVHQRPRYRGRRIGNDLRPGRSREVSADRQLASRPEGLVQPSVPRVRAEREGARGYLSSAEDPQDAAALIIG